MEVMPSRAALASGQKAGVPCTLLALVQMLTDALGDEEEVVDTASALVNRGVVRLTGNFRGQRLELARAG
jgi:hypothetical protein